MGKFVWVLTVEENVSTVLIGYRGHCSGDRRRLRLWLGWASFGGSQHGLGRRLPGVGSLEVWRINSHTWITRAQLYSCVSLTPS